MECIGRHCKNGIIHIKKQRESNALNNKICNTLIILISGYLVLSTMFLRPDGFILLMFVIIIDCMMLLSLVALVCVKIHEKDEEMMLKKPPRHEK